MRKNAFSLKVAVALPVAGTYDYAVPDYLEDRVRIGARVRIPFGNRQTLGYALARESLCGNRELKDILDVLDEEPLFHSGQIPFFQWMADYYLCPLGPLIQSVLPGGLNARSFKTASLTRKGEEILPLLSGKSEEAEALLWVRGHPGKRLSLPPVLVRKLQKRGWIEIKTGAGRQGTGPLSKKCIRVCESVDFEAFLEEKIRALGAENEEAFLREVKESGGILLGDLSSRYPNGRYLARKWSQKGLLEIYDRVVFRTPSGGVILPPPPPRSLSPQQKKVLETIAGRLQRGGFTACLLHGVTGSGKTEVYYRAVEEARHVGRQTILMVPEIALAVYMQGLFRSRLGDRVAIYHSGLGEGERYDEWLRMARGEVDLVIGARSALFAPFPRLGLIVVDEEHDASYKQEEAPRYQARDAAVVRARIEKALVILGSGTPSVQSYHNALSGRYRLLTMPERIEKRAFPEAQAVDMKRVEEEGRGGGILSPQLKKALDSHLARNKQVILFLNRRGFDRVHLCRFCGQWIRCQNCDLAMVYHFGENRLACHYCGLQTRPHTVCPSCGRKGMKSYGFGTERLEQTLADLYPEKRIARMDRDSTRGKGHISQILKKFADREVDILVGTQMITKGYDFPNVTLVGVIAADFSLGFPDFRASERTFQILSQVAGRAGRGEQRGTVIIQTFNPGHYAIATAQNQDYDTFFLQEKELRAQLGYPPFSYLACLRLKGRDKQLTAEMAQWLGRDMMEMIQRWPKRGKEVQVLGPTEAPLARLKGKYRWQILVKSKTSGLLHFFLQKVDDRAKAILRRSGVSLTIDVDPYQML